MRIEIVVYDGFDDLDGFAPYEVFRHAAARIDGWDPADVVLVGAHGPGTVTSAHGVRFEVAEGMSTGCPDGAEGALVDGLVVPGGGWRTGEHGARAEVDDGRLPRVLAASAPMRRWTASVCTGAMLLAAAGLTTGRPATTHHTAHDDLRASGATLLADARVVDDGDLVTAAGVTSGIDLALHIVEREAGRARADDVARHIAYPRQPVTRTERASL